MAADTVGHLMPRQAVAAETVNGLLLGLGEAPDQHQRDEQGHEETPAINAVVVMAGTAPWR